MFEPKRLTAATVAALFLATGAAYAQQEGSVGMDEIDASLSAEGGDEMDARFAENEAMARLHEDQRTIHENQKTLHSNQSRLHEENQRLSEHVSGLQARIEELEKKLADR